MASRQLLIFKLNGNDFGVDITHIDSIVPINEIVKIPNTPVYVEGLMSLRGKVYTIFNLRKRFDLPSCEYNDNTKIVIVNVNSVSLGFIVDEVNEIKLIEDENMDNSPLSVAKLDKQFVNGVAKIEERIIIVLDLEKTLAITE